MRTIPKLLSMVFMAILMACAHQVPVEQIQLFRDAFNNVQTASQQLFDDLAAAEKELGKRVAASNAKEKSGSPPSPPKIVLSPAETNSEEANAVNKLPEISVDRCYESSPGWLSTGAKDGESEPPGFIDGFCLEYSVYFTFLGDPPATQALRNGVEVLGRYSEVLLILAEGRNIDEAKAQLNKIGASIAGTLTIIPGGIAPAALIGPVMNALEKVVDGAAKEQNYKKLANLVINANPMFLRLIAAMKASSPWLFETLIRSFSRRVPIETDKNLELSKTLVNHIEGYRTAVSSFVVLLDEMAVSHKDIVQALKREGETPLTLDFLANQAEKLNTQANALRDAFVILRRGAI